LILHATDIGQGPPVALLHGLFGAGRNLGALQRALSTRHRVLSLDLRNHGDSPHVEGMDYADMAQDVLQTLGEAGALPCALLGHSMGGKVAMRAALSAPDQVSRLLVADIAPVPYRGDFAAYAAAMQALRLTQGLTRAEADAALAEAVPDPGVRGFLLQNLRFTNPPSWRIGLSEIARALPEILDWPAPPRSSYDGPTLFVSGARSNYIRPEHRSIIRALFPRASIVTLKDAGHWLHADNPNGFRAVVEMFLN
jgi:pimeloyl-ACP methyl ester carboxylesterase